MPGTKNAPAEAEAPKNTRNASTPFDRLRAAESAHTGDPLAKCVLLVLTRAADNKTRALEVSQSWIAQRVEMDPKTVRTKLGILDGRFIVRQRQTDRYGHRRWDRTLVLDLQPDGTPVRGEQGAVGLAGGEPVWPNGRTAGPNGRSRRVSTKGATAKETQTSSSSPSVCQSEEGTTAETKPSAPVRSPTSRSGKRTPRYTSTATRQPKCQTGAQPLRPLTFLGKPNPFDPRNRDGTLPQRQRRSERHWFLAMIEEEDAAHA